MASRHFWRVWKAVAVKDFMQYRHDGEADQRRHILQTINDAGFLWPVVYVAGTGFLTDAYGIFALNVVLQMLGYAYWDHNGTVPVRVKTSLLCATLGGTIFGMILFGVLGDRYGRAKMYTWQLAIFLAATILVTMSSAGANSSMSIEVWLAVWRFVLGIAIGADYPLSAAITVEMAPRRHRKNMLAWVLLMQPIGQLLAQVVALVAVFLGRHALMAGSNPIEPYCTGSCVQSADRIWRAIVGIGAVPAIIALALRLTIPETVYWTGDVKGSWAEAEATVTKLHGSRVGSTEERRTASSPRTNGPVPHGDDQDSPQNREPDSRNTSNSSQGLASTLCIVPYVPFEPRRRHGPHTHAEKPQSSIITRDIVPPKPSYDDCVDFFIRQGNWLYLFGTSSTWFLQDIGFFGLGLTSSTIITAIWYSKASLSEAPQFSQVYDLLFSVTWHEVIVLTLGAICGGALFIYTVRLTSTFWCQLIGFLILVPLLLIAGCTFQEARGPGLVTLYVLCQFVFDLGPNRTTYMIPAEIFPTRYRCSCHGISAAWGKIGALVAELFFSYYAPDGQTIATPGEPWFGWSTAVMAGFMLLAALLTCIALPHNMRDARNRERSLDVLGEGRKMMSALGGLTHPVDEDTAGGEGIGLDDGAST